MADAPRRLVVDCDTGIDDAVTLLYLAGRTDVALEAVGAVHGNVPAPTAARNTLRVLEVAGLADVPVAVGAHRPLAQVLSTAERVHGPDGLGGTDQPAPAGSPVLLSAAEQLVSLARESPGRLSLLAIGPLTNVALALLLEPRLPDLLDRVVVMGGAVGHPGNVSAVAEANVANDPEAADLVLGAGFDLGLVPLDVTHATLLGSEDLGRIEAGTGAVARFIWPVLQWYLDVYEARVGERACPVHDGLAAALLLEPGLATWERRPVTVELRGEQTRGMTLADRRWGERPPDDRPAVDIATAVDRDAAVEGLLRALGV